MTEPAYTLKQLARAPNVVRAAVIENEWRIADLEAENARLVEALDEAQGKLEAVGEWMCGLNAPDDWAVELGGVRADLDRILRGSKEDAAPELTT